MKVIKDTDQVYGNWDKTIYHNAQNIDRHIISTSNSIGENKVTKLIKQIMGIWQGTQFTQRYRHVADKK